MKTDLQTFEEPVAIKKLGVETEQLHDVRIKLTSNNKKNIEKSFKILIF